MPRHWYKEANLILTFKVLLLLVDQIKHCQNINFTYIVLANKQFIKYFLTQRRSPGYEALYLAINCDLFYLFYITYLLIIIRC